jgi:hypothetical protein
MKKSILILSLLPSILIARIWTNSEGQSFEGAHIFHNDAFVHIQREYDNKTFARACILVIENGRLLLGPNSKTFHNLGHSYFVLAFLK